MDLILILIHNLVAVWHNVLVWRGEGSATPHPMREAVTVQSTINRPVQS